MGRDPRAELADLAADLRAWLEAAEVRGAVADVPGEVARAETGPAPSAPAAEPTPDASAERWLEVAANARADAGQLTGEAGLRQIREDLGDCRRCKLCTGRTNIVFGVGDPEADLMVIGEAPGFHEDRQGEPFVGKAGEMLDRMLKNVLGLDRAEVYIANIVKCRPPNNRNPMPDEVDACLPFLRRQVAAIRPRVILVLGTVALKALWTIDRGGITRWRGKWRDFEGIPAMPMFHPAYLLRNPAGKRPAFEDLKACRARYDELGGKRRGSH